MLCPLSYEDARIPILADSRTGDYLTRPHPYLPFFVYGTLLPGQPNYGIWEAAITAVRPAEMAGCGLYDLGHYPMLVPSGGGRVRGMVVDMDPGAYPEVVAALDYLEGVDMAAPGEPAYQRVRRVASLASGHQVVTWVYLGDPTFAAGLPALETDWKSHCRATRRDLDTWWAGVASVVAQSPASAERSR